MIDNAAWHIDEYNRTWLGDYGPLGEPRCVGLITRLPVSGYRWQIMRTPGGDTVKSGHHDNYNGAMSAAGRAWNEVRKEAKAA